MIFGSYFRKNCVFQKSLSYHGAIRDVYAFTEKLTGRINFIFFLIDTKLWKMYIYKNPLTISQLSCELRTPLFKNFKKNCKIWFLKGCCEEKDRERYCVHPTHSRYIWKLPLLHFIYPAYLSIRVVTDWNTVYMFTSLRRQF